MARTQPKLLALAIAIFFSGYKLNPTLAASESDGFSVDKSTGVYLNQWAVHIDGDARDAEAIAQAHGFSNTGQIGTLENYYLFEHHGVSKRSTTASNHHSTLKKHPKVRWVEQQVAKKRVKRDYQTSYPPMRDPLWEKQWYLHGGATGGYDMNVLSAWKKGYTGRGVVVTILDDGLEHTHADLKRNYDPEASYDINGGDVDPMPRYDTTNENRHGTRCAGEVGAMANNTKCAVGIAFNAKIGGVRMLDGDVSDAVEARSLSLSRNHIDIYSASWGPDDNGKVVDGPAILARKAFADGIQLGRGGKGSIFVWASGNGGSQYDSCNCDGYTNSLFTLSISSVSERGTKPWYLEECSSTLATTYSSGENYGDRKIVTTDLHGECTEAHTGTSASAPLAAGICALALEANPDLTWRDMQYVVMMTARPEPLLDGDWSVNGVGRKVSLKYGYGLMDAAAMVDLASRWNTVPEQHICASPVTMLNIPIDSEGLQTTVSTEGCALTRNSIRYLEHVQAKVSLRYSRRGDVQLHLVSPNGTRSLLLLKRKKDYEEGEFRQWPFMSVQFWGEDPRGTWTLEVEDVGTQLNTGTFFQWQLILYGVAEEPVHLRPAPVQPPPDVKGSNFADISNVTKAVSPNAEEEISQIDEDEIGKSFDTDESWNTETDIAEGNGGADSFEDGTNHLAEEDTNAKEDQGEGDDIIGPLPQDTGGMIDSDLEEKTEEMDKVEIGSHPEGKEDEEKEEKLENESWLPGKEWNFNPDNKRLSCHYECEAELGCHGPDAKDCHTCRHARLHQGGPCVGECPERTYLDPDSGLCQPCSPMCSQCTGPDHTDCLSCPPDHYLMETNHTCLLQCPQGYLQVEGECLPCELPCVTCKGDPNRCTSCEPDWELSDNLCHPACQLYHFRYGDRCEPCISNCEVCVGGRGEDCQACGHGHFLQNHTCVYACGEGYYPANTNHGGECLRCHSSCYNCKGGGEDECTECATPLTLHHQQCLLLCEQGEYKSDAGDCQPCDIGCETCSGQSGYDCLSCPLEKYLHNGECVFACPEGHFSTSSEVTDRVCAECLPPCASCQGSPANCTSCLLDLRLEGNECLVHCSEGEYHGREGCDSCHPTCEECSGPEAAQCTSCPENSHLHYGHCLPECPDGFYGKAEHCLKCHTSCLTCKGDGMKDCLSCNVSHTLTDGACVTASNTMNSSASLPASIKASIHCDNGTYPNITTQKCVPCDETCATCDGRGPYHCLTCAAPRSFYLKLNSCVLCCSEDVSQSCCSCHPKTGVCMENRNIDYDNIPIQEQSPQSYPTQQPALQPTRSWLVPRHAFQSGIISLVVVFCVFSLIVFLVVFGILQARSNKRMCWYRHYQPVPMYYHDGSDKVTLSKEDFEDEDSVSSA